jgi:ribosome recycling factor
MTTDLNNFDDGCKKSVAAFKRELGKMRTGRASSSLLEGLMVDYYGTQVPLVQLGNVSVPEPRLITIQVYDAGAIDSIEKAIRQADLGLNPSRDGSLVRLSIPALTEERRKEIVKKLNKMGEEARVAIRNLRRDVMEFIKTQEKDKKISTDDLKRHQETVQKVTDKNIKEIDDMVVAKEKEIMSV